MSARTLTALRRKLHAGSATLQAIGAALAFALILGWFGPTLDNRTYADYGYAADQQGEHRLLELEARRVCDAMAGENSGWRLVADGVIVCTDKRGRQQGGTVKLLQGFEL